MTASDTLWAMTGLGAVILGGFVVWSLQQQKTTQQTTTTPSQSPLVAAAAAAATGTTQGGTRGYNYTITPQAYSTSPTDVFKLAQTTQDVISAGVGSALAPVLAPINALGGWVGGLI